jgi:teichuronic acid biosynthesis glycosyltransferase TuaC
VLVEAGDVAALSARIDALLAAPAELAELGRRARTTVERAFTWERCGRETMSAYGHGLRADLESDV